MLIDHASLKFVHYQEQLLKAIQQIRALHEEKQPDMQCTIIPAFMSINEEPDEIEEIPNTFAYHDIQNVSEMKTKEKESYTSDEFKVLAQYNMTDAEYIQTLHQCTDLQKINPTLCRWKYSEFGTRPSC